MFIHNTRHHMMPFGKVHIFPGDNELTEEHVAALRPYDAGLQSAIKAGWLSVNDGPVEDKRVDTSAAQMGKLFGGADGEEEPAKEVETSPLNSDDFAEQLAARMRGEE